MSKRLLCSLVGFFIAMTTVSFAEAQSIGNKKRRKMGDLTLKKIQLTIPKSKQVVKKKKIKARNIGLIKPPSSSKFYEYDANPLKAEYHRLLDVEIKKLFKMSKQYKRSRSRGEIWLRLGERYVEKARIVEFKLQDNYDRKLKAFHSGKTKRKPRPPKTTAVKGYNKRAMQLYEWYVRDFPKSKKVPQALFFLGYNNFEIGRLKSGEKYYLELTRKYSRSPYVTESYFALAEYYFEKEDWKRALGYYNKIVKRSRSRLYNFALYKASWCHYRLSRYKTGLATLEKVIRVSRAGGTSSKLAGTKSVDRLRLADEALKDYVGFYEPTGRYKGAYQDFASISRSEKKAIKMLDALAYRYSYAGNLKGSTYLFRQLIAMNPDGEKSSKYQFQIATDYAATGRNKEFQKELSRWITKFGKKSGWANANAGKPKVLSENFKLQESTLRNHTLQLHKQALKSRTKYSKKLAAGSYKMYLSFFKSTQQYSEMRFFYGELLYDLQEFPGAAQQYGWLAKSAPKSKYFKQAVTNNVLALSKGLPKNGVVEAKRKSLKNPLQKIPLSPGIVKFAEASRIYLKYFPKGEKAPEIRKQLGMLYYTHNHFDPALAIFRGIIKSNPKSKDAITSADIVLDSHRLRNNLVAYQKEGNKFLQNKYIANSAFGKELKVNLQKAKFLVANNYSKKGNFVKSAQAFEDFAKTSPHSKQAGSALINSASNYEKGNKYFDAIRMYNRVAVIGGKGIDLKDKQDARNSLAILHKRVGNLEASASNYYSYGRNEKGSKGANAIFNAAILWDALNNSEAASRAYSEFAKRGRRQELRDSTFAQAKMYRRLKNYGKTNMYYNKFLGLSSPKLERVIESHYEIASMYREQRQYAKANQWYQKIIRITRSGRGKSIGAKEGAESKYYISRAGLSQMKAVRLGTTEASITVGLKKLKGQQERLEKDMIAVVKYNYGPMIVAAFQAQGESFEIISNAWKTAPVPSNKGYGNPQVAKQFRDLTKKNANDFMAKAKDSYRRAYNKGVQIKVYSEELVTAARDLYRVDPVNFRQAGELAATSNVIDRMGL